MMHPRRSAARDFCIIAGKCAAIIGKSIVGTVAMFGFAAVLIFIMAIM